MGEEAWQLLGGDSGNVLAVRPLRSGIMTEFDITQRMIEVVDPPRAAPRGSRGPACSSACPRMSSEVERRAIEEAMRFAGVRQRDARGGAARGRDRRRACRSTSRSGNLVVDIGGGHVGDGGGVDGRRGERALGRAREGSTSTRRSRSTSVTTYGVAIGEKAAEEIKIAIGSAFPTPGGNAARRDRAASSPRGTRSR